MYCWDFEPEWHLWYTNITKCQIINNKPQRRRVSKRKFESSEATSVLVEVLAWKDPVGFKDFFQHFWVNGTFAGRRLDWIDLLSLPVSGAVESSGGRWTHLRLATAVRKVASRCLWLVGWDSQLSVLNASVLCVWRMRETAFGCFVILHWWRIWFHWSLQPRESFWWTFSSLSSVSEGLFLIWNWDYFLVARYFYLR